MDQKLPRQKRLTRKEEFDRVFTGGKKITHQGVTAYLLFSTHPRMGFAVTKKYGNQVQRNRFKRRARSVFRKHYDQLPAADMVLTTARVGGEISSQQIEAFFQYVIYRGQKSSKTHRS